MCAYRDAYNRSLVGLGVCRYLWVHRCPWAFVGALCGVRDLAVPACVGVTNVTVAQKTVTLPPLKGPSSVEGLVSVLHEGIRLRLVLHLSLKWVEVRRDFLRGIL